MVQRWPGREQLELVSELNRLFLTCLENCSSREQDQLGFPTVARASLRAASTADLDAVALFPRALFELRLPPDGARGADPRASRGESTRQSMNLMILCQARTLSRQSVYQARLLLGLESRAIQRLRGLELGGLRALAQAPDVVACAFAQRDWLWPELLAAVTPAARERLTLIALQPGLERDWPQRRFAPVAS